MKENKMSVSFEDKDLPEVIIEDSRTNDAYTYVQVGDWNFCVEDDLEDSDTARWWNDVKSWVAYAQYLDKVKAERKV